MAYMDARPLAVDWYADRACQYYLGLTRLAAESVGTARHMVGTIAVGSVVVFDSIFARSDIRLGRWGPDG
jgi:hypothetical protein